MQATSCFGSMTLICRDGLAQCQSCVQAGGCTEQCWMPTCAIAWQAVTVSGLFLVCRLAAVHLVDAHLCSDPAKYLSALLLSLSVMLHLELPHVNVLSKIDLIEQYGQLDFNLDFYTEVGQTCCCLPAMPSAGLPHSKRRGMLAPACFEPACCRWSGCPTCLKLACTRKAYLALNKRQS